MMMNSAELTVPVTVPDASAAAAAARAALAATAPLAQATAALSAYGMPYGDGAGAGADAASAGAQLQYLVGAQLQPGLPLDAYGAGGHAAAEQQSPWFAVAGGVEGGIQPLEYSPSQLTVRAAGGPSAPPPGTCSVGATRPAAAGGA